MISSPVRYPCLAFFFSSDVGLRIELVGVSVGAGVGVWVGATGVCVAGAVGTGELVTMGTWVPMGAKVGVGVAKFAIIGVGVASRS